MFAVVTALESGKLVGQWHHSAWAGVVIFLLIAMAVIGIGMHSFRTARQLTKRLPQFVSRVPLQTNCGAVNAMTIGISGEGDAQILVSFSDYTQAAWGCDASIKTVGAIAEKSAVPLASGEGRFSPWRSPLRIKANGRWAGQLLIHQNPTAPRGILLRSFHLRGNLQASQNNDNTHVVISSWGCVVRGLDHESSTQDGGAPGINQIVSSRPFRPLAGPDERYRMAIAGSVTAITGAVAFLAIGATVLNLSFAIVMAPLALATVAAHLILSISAVRPRGPLQLMRTVESKCVTLHGSGRALIEIIRDETTMRPETCVVRTTSGCGKSRGECHLIFPATCGPVNAGEVKIHERGAWTAQIQWHTGNEDRNTQGPMIFAWARHAVTVSSGNEMAASDVQ